jgi:hypothetical protein
MSFKIEAATMIPALFLAIVAIHLSFFSLITTDPNLKRISLLFAVSFFFGGVAMALCWIFYWAVYKKLL